MSKIVIREDESLFSVTYDPSERDPSNTRSYENCRTQIDDAHKERTINAEQKEWLIGRLNHERSSYIIDQREQGNL